LGVARESDHAFELPAGHPDAGQSIAAYYFWVFPNLMFNFYPWGLSINIVRPLGPDVTKVQFIPYVWREELRGSGAGADLDRVEREDEAVVEMVQKGLRSRLYTRGRYSPTGEVATHHFHRLLAAALQ
jgi:choline monooxygenase